MVSILLLVGARLGIEPKLADFRGNASFHYPRGSQLLYRVRLGLLQNVYDAFQNVGRDCRHKYGIVVKRFD